MPEIGDHEKIGVYSPDLEMPVPAQRPMPGTPLPERMRDPERETVPVSFSPTRTRTQPFLPARRNPNPGPEHAPVSIIHEVTPVQPLTHSPGPGPESIQQPENAPKNSGKNSDRPKFHPNFSKPESELPQKPTTPLQPKFTTKLYDKPTERKKRGRQRAKDRTSHLDGVRKLFELWWHKGSRGVAFGKFYRGHLSDDMRSYYVKEYIYGRNDKSHAEYKQWRAEWDAKHAVKTA